MRRAHMTTHLLSFALVDVFTSTPLSGNSLSVFLLDTELSTRAMQRITVEMRQFESIFLRRIGDSNHFDTRIFTMQEELAFAGHPIIGAGAVLHAQLWPNDRAVTIGFAIGGRLITTIARREGAASLVEMDQGCASFGADVPTDRYDALLRALNLSPQDRAPGLPMQVISTGLAYLIVPVRSGLDQARIANDNFEALLAQVGAKFVYVFDVERREGRTWDNVGLVEDIATGSAAGPTGAFLVAHGLATRDEFFVLRQGRLVGRPSELYVKVVGASKFSITVRGQVCPVGGGALTLPSESL